MHPVLAGLAASQNGPFTRAQALAAGYTPSEIRHLIARREWIALRRGVLATRVTVEGASSRRGTHLLTAAAALLVLGCDPVVSHRSAALAWDLPLLGREPHDVELTTDRQNRRRTTGLAIHTARTPAHHRAHVAGLAVTSVARTVSDLARATSMRAAVVVADAALNRRLCTADDLAQVISDCWVWRGIARTKRVASLADGRSESPGESLSRLAIIEHGLPEPELQTELVLEGRRVRTDFFWRDCRLVGEFDGRTKYTDPAALWDEKQREDLIRRSGYGVVRWVWDEVYPDPTSFLARLGRGLSAHRG